MTNDNPADSRKDARSVSNRTIEIVTAAIVLAFGLLFLYSSYRLGFRWGSDGPQSGFFPFYVSLFLSIASLSVLVQALRGTVARAGEKFVDLAQFRQVLAVLVPAVFFVLGIQLIGIYVAAFLYITVFMLWLGKYSWLRSIVIALIVSVVSFMMFEVWFQVPLYKGLWNPLAWTGY
jgi:putative tricarboxylic transport membrane protein